MAFTRTAILLFSTVNPLYAAATVSVFEVDDAGETTTTLATLYSDPTGTGTLANPQQLDGNGKWRRPVYIDHNVDIYVSGNGFPAHTTGLIQYNEAASFFVERFIATAGSDDYTLHRDCFTDAGVHITFDGVYQEPTGAYVVSSSDHRTVHWSSPFLGGELVVIVHQATPSNLRVPGAGTVNADSLTNDPSELSLIAGKISALSAIPSMASLADLPYGGRAHVFVEGYYHPDDGGGGMFRWDPSSTGTDDGGTIIQPSGHTGAGRWLRTITGNQVDPLMFGAAEGGAGNQGPAINKMLAYIFAQYANGTGRKITARMVGIYRTEQSFIVDASFSMLCDCTIIVGPTSGFNEIRMWNGEGSGIRCCFDFRRGQNARFDGRIQVNNEVVATVPTGDSLAAIGASTNIYVVPTDLAVAPNTPGIGGSNTTWGAIRTDGVDYVLYTPGLGAAAPASIAAQFPLFTSSDWQVSPVILSNNIDYLARPYATGEIVTSNRRVYQATVGGTPVSGPIYSANVFDFWEFIADRAIEGVLPWTAGENVALNAYRTAGTNTYRRTAAGVASPAMPVHQGNAVPEAAGATILAWNTAPNPVLGEYRTSGVNMYLLTVVGTVNPVTAPSHTTQTPVADANGWTWAYAGPANVPTWQYLRIASFNASGTGMKVDHAFQTNGKSIIVSSATATDDCYWSVMRTSGSKGSVIQNNGGFVTLGTLFASANSAITGAFSVSTSDTGQICIQNYGTLIAQYLYLSQEWSRGILMAHESVTIANLEADADFKTASGPIAETQPDATRMQARLLIGPSALATPSSDYRPIAVTAGQSYLEGGSISWPSGGGGSAGTGRTLSFVLPAASNTAGFMVYRLLTGGAPGTGVVITGDKAGGGSMTGTTTAKVQGTTLAAGVVGLNAVDVLPGYSGGFLIRQIELETYTLSRSVVPFRTTRTNGISTVQSQDRFVCRNPDDPIGILYRYTQGLLRPMAADGWFVQASVSTPTLLIYGNGATQQWTIAASGGITLPTTLNASTDHAPRGGRRHLRIINGGLATGGYPFTVDANHPAITWVGPPPVFPASGTVEVEVWCPDGQNWRGRAQPVYARTAITFATSLTLNLYNFKNGAFTASNNFTVNAPSNPIVGQEGDIYITQDGTGSRIVTWNSAFKFDGGAAATGVLSTAASAIDRLHYTVVSGTEIYCSLHKDAKA